MPTLEPPRTLVDPFGALTHIRRTSEGPLHLRVHRIIRHDTPSLVVSKKPEKKA